MSWELLSASKKTKGATLDPRTKLIVLITICFLVLGGEGGGLALVTKPMLTAIPILLLFFFRKKKAALVFVFIVINPPDFLCLLSMFDYAAVILQDGDIIHLPL